jgi:hypothetical protein
LELCGFQKMEFGKIQVPFFPLYLFHKNIVFF